MSLSPFRRGSALPTQPASSSRPPARADDPLTFSQALTITAGLAGLIGLLSGGLIRFSLANSSDARLLSPLQTFPVLSDWPSSESTQGNSGGHPAETSAKTLEGNVDPLSLETIEVFPAEIETLEDAETRDEDSWREDAWDQESELDWQPNEDFDNFSSERFTGAPESSTLRLWEDAPTNFDDFAERSAERSPSAQGDPLKSLSKGPRLWNEPEDEQAISSSDRLRTFSDSDFIEEDFSEDDFSEDSFSEDSFSERADMLDQDRF